MSKQTLLMEIQESTKVPQGEHTGKITNIEQRHVTKDKNEYDYVDFVVSVGDIEEDLTLRYSIPANVSVNTELGKTLIRFGYNIEDSKKFAVGTSIDVYELVGVDVKYVVMDDDTPRGTFAKIVKGSLKPLKA